MHGFLVIDKPGGITSHDIVRRIRRKLGIKRVGHGGTLDPMATGLVPVAVGDAIRLLEFFSDSDKGYQATMRLGETTDSQDADGEIIATADWQGLQESDVDFKLGTTRNVLDHTGSNLISRLLDIIPVIEGVIDKAPDVAPELAEVKRTIEKVLYSEGQNFDRLSQQLDQVLQHFANMKRLLSGEAPEEIRGDRRLFPPAAS